MMIEKQKLELEDNVLEDDDGKVEKQRLDLGDGDGKVETGVGATFWSR